jgi:DNA-directed DNA polymerase III PolC
MPVPLHVHSWFSFLEGAASPETLLERALACGYKTLALTDTNNLYGAVKFVDQAKAHDVRPLLGACLRLERQHCVALIADRAGYRSLCRILSRLYLQREKPPKLTDLLTDNAQGLHVLVDDAAFAERLRDPFDKRLWVEIVRPGRSARQEQDLLVCARRLGLPLVASSAVHLATPDDYPAFRLATAVRRGILLDQFPRQLPITPDHHLIDADTLSQRFHDLPQAIRNTEGLAGQIEEDVLPSERVLPAPRVPRSMEASGYLRLLCERGLRRRGLAGQPAARQRLAEELAIIESASLASYFLVVRNIARYAQRKGYGMALRGSAGNSLVCFLLEITDVDPLRFGLPMERFLHPNRPDLPDIDLDFDWKVRDDVIDHVFRRYGDRHTAMISSHLFLQPRSAFREAAKIHGLSNEQISRLLETLSERVDDFLAAESEESRVGDEGSRHAPRDGSPFTNSPFSTLHSPPVAFPLEPERWPRILADARLLLGRPHHLSVHPGGVVVTPDPAEDYVPLQRAPKGVIITQFEKDAAEAIGLVKIDLLGNRALSTVDEALRIVDRHCGDTVAAGQAQAKACGYRSRQRFRAASIPADGDPETVALLQIADTLGVNQLESPAMRHLLRQIDPQGLDQVIQGLALVRPGAASLNEKQTFIRRRRGLEAVRYLHPSLEPVLRETYGVMIYEDDGLRVIQTLTGLPAPDADQLRKRIVKCRNDAEGQVLAKQFLTTCMSQGIPEETAQEQWVQLSKFTYYSFCKSHAVSYGLIAWTAAYLKTHYPLCFWTAALNNNQGVYPRRVYIEAIKRSDIEVRLPCVNHSSGPFAVEGDAIRTGLESIASLDEKTRQTVLADRQERGPYGDLMDFRKRVAAGPDALALLIRSGAMDFTGKPRPALFLEAELQDRLDIPAERNRPRLFADEGDWGWCPADYDANRRLHDEWDLLGFVVGPPLMSLFRPRLPRGLVMSRELPEHVGRVVHLAGVVAASRLNPTVKGETMQFVTLEDEWGLIETTLFPGTCPPVAYLMLGPYIVTGLVEEQCGVITVTAHTFRRAFPDRATTAFAHRSDIAAAQP